MQGPGAKAHGRAETEKGLNKGVVGAYKEGTWHAYQLCRVTFHHRVSQDSLPTLVGIFGIMTKQKRCVCVCVDLIA